MAYSYGIKNKFRPTRLAPNAYGWSNRPAYTQADIPTALMDRPTDLTVDQFRQQFAYEWFQSSDTDAKGFGGVGFSNPPFVSGAAGRLHPLLRDAVTGKPARILRGYIRRADFDSKDDTSKARLYFMFNPEVITRDYVSYLEQTALDPFNSVYQSGNLVAPPSFMDFGFSLIFDRQEEAQQPDHPGVYVDYQFFDLVVRNVIPTDPNQSSNTLPDNGIMMVNPRDITVVFSPQLTVQGRPLNASVTFEKFTHRMTPTRMTIQLRMRAVYMGPAKDMVEYKKEEFQAEAAIPLDSVKATSYSWNDNDENALDVLKNSNNANIQEIGESLAQQFGQANDQNHAMRLQALQWAMDNVQQGGPGAYHALDSGWTNYTGADSGTMRYGIPIGADCSGLVTHAYIKVGLGDRVKWSGHPGTAVMIDIALKNRGLFLYSELNTFDWQHDLLPGDILIRQGHVGFFVKYSGTNCIIFDAASSTSKPEVGQRTVTGHGSFTHLLRPTPHGDVTAASQSSIWNTAFGSIAGLRSSLVKAT